MLRKNRHISRRRTVACAFAVGAISAIGLAACSSASSSATSSATSSGTSAKQVTIAFISQGTSNSWAAQLDAVARKTANQLGAKLTYFNGQGNATTQLPLIEQAIAEHPDAIVLVPLGQAADTGPVERAMAAGIKVILLDSTVNTSNYTSLINPDAATASVPLAQWLAKKMNYKGNLLYVGGLPGNATTILYDKGFYSVMNKYPNIHIVNAGNANYSISTAKQLTATAIASGKKFTGAWGVGGEAVTGIMLAYADSSIRPIPPVAGAAATNGTLRLALQDNIEAAMLQFPPTDAQVAIQTAYKAALGQTVPKYINISTLPQYGDIFPPLNAYYKPQYSDDMYVGTNAVLSDSELRSLNLLK
jgi:ribose transport system substrate-binding protein